MAVTSSVGTQKIGSVASHSLQGWPWATLSMPVCIGHCVGQLWYRFACLSRVVGVGGNRMIHIHSSQFLCDLQVSQWKDQWCMMWRALLSLGELCLPWFTPITNMNITEKSGTVAMWLCHSSEFGLCVHVLHICMYVCMMYVTIDAQVCSSMWKAEANIRYFPQLLSISLLR